MSAPLRKRMVLAGHLGQKTGEGFHSDRTCCQRSLAVTASATRSTSVGST